MPAREVRAVVDWLDAERVVHQINGGWAVDALVGRRTRRHGDLDVFLDADRLQDTVDWLVLRGYRTVADERPVRLELRRGRYAVDLHPMVLDADGNGTQEGFEGAVFEHRVSSRTEGTVAGRTVVVADIDRLIELRQGYPARPRDVHDLRLLRRLKARRSSGSAR